MRKRSARGAAIAVVLGSFLATTGVVAAQATTEYPSVGGTWNYGVYEPASTVYVYSDYYHKDRKHRSSVQVHNGTIYRSADAAKGTWSKVEKQTYYGGNGAWYYAY